MQRDILIESGFAPKTYDGQEGEFLTKKIRVGDMSSAFTDLIDHEYIFDTSEAIVEVTPCGKVQVLILDADYLEGPYPMDSDNGKTLLKTAAGLS
jgi:hypothetical protein